MERKNTHSYGCMCVNVLLGSKFIVPVCRHRMHINACIGVCVCVLVLMFVIIGTSLRRQSSYMRIHNIHTKVAPSHKPIKSVRYNACWSSLSSPLSSTTEKNGLFVVAAAAIYTEPYLTKRSMFLIFSCMCIKNTHLPFYIW